MNHEHLESDTGKYEVVGWLSITSAILLFPSMALGILLEVSYKPVIVIFLLPYVLLFGLSIGLSLYVLHRFKRLLNERYQFHEVDNIITAIVILGCVFGVVGTAMKVLGTFVKVNTQEPTTLIPLVVVALAIFAVVGLPLCVLNIIFAVKLLRLGDNLFGLLKPYAYTTIIASGLFATFLLAFVGFFLDAACSVMLGLIFLRAARGMPQLEFV